MTIFEQTKALCVQSDISVAELAKRIETTSQNLGKRKSFMIEELRISQRL